MNSLKKILVITIFGLIFIFGYNFLLEYSLDKTSREFTKSLNKVERNYLLELALLTHDLPRPYRKQDSYSDLNGLVLSLLYLNNDGNLANTAWSIRTALKVLDEGIQKYSSNSKEHYYLQLKKLSILNRAPSRSVREVRQMYAYIEELEKNSNFIDISKENSAYIQIEKMLLEANSGNHVKALSSFSEAVDILKKGNQETLSVNLKKFEFYNGYALCLAGDAKGGDVMLESLKHLSQYSATFKEAMIVNWDSPLIGLLRSRNSAGYTACHNVANLMKIYL